jgi:hypothetical protein
MTRASVMSTREGCFFFCNKRKIRNLILYHVLQNSAFETSNSSAHVMKYANMLAGGWRLLLTAYPN